MIGELLIIDDNEIYLKDSNQEKFWMPFSLHDFCLGVYLEQGENINDIFKNKKRFLKDINRELENSDPEIIKNGNYVKDNFDNILDHIEYIILNFKKLDILDFIKQNEILQNKKIVIDEHINITDYEKILNILEKYKDYKQNIYVRLKGNIEYVSLEECKKVMEYILNQASKIKQLELSPMEEVMYVYDLVRNKVYKKEDEIDEISESRDLVKVLFGDKIVCAGYSNIFNALLTTLGIKNNEVILSSNNESHQRSSVYIKDLKYGIDGLYYFDPTWDSKKEENSNKYLYNYVHFLKTKKEMDDMDLSIKDESILEYSSKLYEDIKSIIDKKEYHLLINYVITLNNMAKLIGIEKLLSVEKIFNFENEINIKEFLEQLKNLISKFERPIKAETMIELLINVRKIEYYQNPDWYPYSIDTIYKTLICSKWEFNEIYYGEKEKLLKSLFDISLPHSIKDDFIAYMNENDKFKEIETIRFTKVLQKIYDIKK